LGKSIGFFMSKEKIVPQDPRDLIMAKMTGEGRMIKWLAEITEIPYGTLYGCLVRRQFSLSDENLKLINKALETDFAQLSE